VKKTVRGAFPEVVLVENLPVSVGDAVAVVESWISILL